MGMKALPTAAIVLLTFMCSALGMWGSWANAESQLGSDRKSRLQPHCDLCWEPSPYEQSPNRLPTHKYQRPRRPPDSRPHRIPKGGYKLKPNKKQTRSSFLKGRARYDVNRMSAQRIVVIDGDTIRVGSNRIRLRGIDTPEMNEPEGQAAKERLEELLRDESPEIVPYGRDVYDRLVADVLVNGQNVAEILESEGFAKSK